MGQSEITEDPMEPELHLMEPELLSMAAASRILGCSRTTIYSLASRNLVPVVRIGRSVRIPRRLLMEWIDTAAAEGRRIDTRP